MNRIYNWIVVLITAISSPWLVSCEDQDSTQAMVLSGQWTGNFGMYYDYEYRGRVYSFDADYTAIGIDGSHIGVATAVSHIACCRRSQCGRR